ncbi:helix-turn-helix domain-containing protein [Pedobacter sp. MC2016-15]|uniref:helix-turn-helix domain-containing protein n=1 Tax=Pedobacter sp. MC2016-15 TaxID=2994473 RepID=UPI002247AB6F|nr:helix-turn-helix transcriptional regulator [Pedobacter sp. MC2016-15]MCX2479424.1 helix-turn-helix domain-containing protein [Pedobacter sp. MC2016-15]
MSHQIIAPVRHVNYGKKWVPESNEMQAVFQVLPIPADNQPLICKPYNIKGLFKISIHHGHNRIHYADKVIEFKEYAILFSRTNMVYQFEPLGPQHPGYLCVFTNEFFDRFVNIIDYPLFDPEVSPLMEITEEQMSAFTKVFQQMEQELAEDFSYKYDVIRTMVLQLILDALKQQPAPELQIRESNSALRIASHFKELLEGQFPIISTSHKILLRHPVEFSEATAVHVNHLNRSLKRVTGNTTSQLIAERIAKEAKILLQDTAWNVIEISWCLGFEDITHFNKFFKKHTGQTPSAFRKTLVI